MNNERPVQWMKEVILIGSFYYHCGEIMETHYYQEFFYGFSEFVQCKVCKFGFLKRRYQTEPYQASGMPYRYYKHPIGGDCPYCGNDHRMCRLANPHECKCNPNDPLNEFKYK